MKNFILIMIVAALAGCATEIPAGNNSLICVNVDAATLFSMFSATTSIRGVVGPTDETGAPALGADQLMKANADCWQDPTAAALIEAIRAIPLPEE